jgi:predicted component of type VI protein secretion system
MSITWTLKIIEPNRPTREFPARDGLVIGSHIDCGVVLMDPKADGHHAKLVADGEGFAVLDLGSDDGTKLGEDTVLLEGQKQSLPTGTELGLGNTKIIIRSDS